MTDKIRIGFVGVGSMGQSADLKNYVTLPDCQVVALAELRPDLGKQVARKYNVPQVYQDASEMLSREKLDGVVAPQPFNRHGQVLPDIYQAGIPVLTEKPLAASIEVGEQLLASLAKGGSWHMVGYHKRSDPATMYAKAEIDRLKQSGELGPLRYVRILMPAGDWVAGGFNDLVQSNEPMPSLSWDPPAADMDRETYAQYVSFVNYYIHQVNLLRHLLGEPYRVTFAEPSGVLLAVRSESGVAGVIEMSPYQTTVDWQESALVAFEKGYIKIELPAPLAHNRPGRIELFSDPGGSVIPQTRTPQMPWIHAMRQQAMNFIAAIQGTIKPPCESAEALDDLRVARDYIRLLKGS